MRLTPEELLRYNENQRKLGLQESTYVGTANAAEGATRDQILEGMMRMSAARAEGRSLCIRSVDHDRADWLRSYKDRRSMGWSIWKSVKNLWGHFKKRQFRL